MFKVICWICCWCMLISICFIYWNVIGCSRCWECLFCKWLIVICVMRCVLFIFFLVENFFWFFWCWFLVCCFFWVIIWKWSYFLLMKVLVCLMLIVCVWWWKFLSNCRCRDGRLELFFMYRRWVSVLLCKCNFIVWWMGRVLLFW